MTARPNFWETFLGVENALVVDLVLKACSAAVDVALLDEEQPVTDAVGKALDLDREQALDRIVQCDERMRAVLGFGLVANISKRRFKGGYHDVSLSHEMEAIVDPASQTRDSGENEAATLALDGESRSFVELIAGIAERRDTAHFILRSEQSVFGLSRDMKVLAAVLSERLLNAPSPRVVIKQGHAKYIAKADQAAVRLIKLAHAEHRSTVFIHDDLFSFSNAVHDDIKTEYSDEDSAQEPNGVFIPPERLAAIARFVGGVHVWCLSPSSLIPHHMVTFFAGAFGPLRFDPDAATALLIQMCPSNVQLSTLGLLRTAFADPRDAQTVTALAVREQANAGSDFDALVSRLTRSLLPHLDVDPIYPSDRPYDLSLVNCDLDLETLLAEPAALLDAGIRLLLHGVPGGGKSALACEIARRLGVPIRIEQAGVLLGSRLGEAERAIARAFRSAASDGALLFIDEADSLLAARDRAGTNRYLAATITNGFLNALDRHTWPVIAATNSIIDIDPAARRRFDYVPELSAMRDDQAFRAWRSVLQMDPPTTWQPSGRAVVADYVSAAKRMKLLRKTSSGDAARQIAFAEAGRLGFTDDPPAFGFIDRRRNR